MRIRDWSSDVCSSDLHGDQWVQVDLLVLGDSLITHIVEGDTVLRYSKPQIGGGNVNDYDPAVKQDGKPLTGGYIALQSESHPVEFRKVALFNLESYMATPSRLQEVLNNLNTRTEYRELSGVPNKKGSAWLFPLRSEERRVRNK